MEKWKEKYEKLKEASGQEWTGIITQVNEKTNKEYFGVEGIYGEKDGIEITIDINDKDNMLKETTFTQWFSIPNSFRGVEKSNLGQFEKLYGDIPKKDLVVNIVLDDNGFFRVVL